MAEVVGRARSVQAVLDLIAERTDGTGRLVVLIDGGSGAGKSVLADDLVTSWRERRTDVPQLVRLDDVYPGWYGLRAGSAAVTDTILRALRPGYRRWDWTADRPAAWVDLDPAAPIVIEGCGSLTREAAPLATVRVWVDLAETVRKERALRRDGEGYAPWWDVWAAQERAHMARNCPPDLADIIVSHDSWPIEPAS